VPAMPAGGRDQVPGPEVLQPEIVARRELGHRLCTDVLYSFYMALTANGRQDWRPGMRRRGISCHLAFLGSGQKSTVRLCPVAAATPHRLLIVARVRPRSRRSALGSAAGRRLVVLSVADVRAPGGALALLAGFR
jgi:hypothetical protein